MSTSSNNSWRDDPRLQGRFHPDYPDDLQVLIHDGGPRLTNTAPELMWVHLIGKRGEVYAGKLLNAPQQLQSVVMGSDILFFVLDGIEHPVRVTQKYLEEKPNWKISACDRCGLGELFDAPSDLIPRLFPSLPDGSSMEMFTTFCALCGGVQGAEFVGASAPKSARKWWQFWK